MYVTTWSVVPICRRPTIYVGHPLIPPAAPPLSGVPTPLFLSIVGKEGPRSASQKGTYTLRIYAGYRHLQCS